MENMDGDGDAFWRGNKKELNKKLLSSHDRLRLMIAHPIPQNDPFFVEACRTVVFGLDAYNKQITGIIPKRQIFYSVNQGEPKFIADIRQYSLEFDNSNVDTLESILDSDPDFLAVLQAYAYEYGARRAFSWCYRDTTLFDIFIDQGFIPTGDFPDLLENLTIQRFYKGLEPCPMDVNQQLHGKLLISEECDADYTEEDVCDLLNDPDSFGIFLQDDKDQSIKGGVMGTIHKAETKGISCGYVDFLWVDSALRTGDSQKTGLGKILMGEAEKLFRQQGAKYAQSTTNGFQAPVFYEKLGYTVIKSCPGYLALEDGLHDIFECTKKL